MIDAESLAKEAGNPKAVNMTLVGAAAALLPISIDALEESAREAFAKKAPRVVEANLKAFKLGAKAAA